MNINTIIIDDFLDDAEYIRRIATSADYPITGNFPGRRTYVCDNEYNSMVIKKIEFILNKKITDWIDHYDHDTESMQKVDTSCFQLCLEGDKTWIHRDPNDYTAILYLTPNAPVESGTGIYRHKSTGIYQYIENNVVFDTDDDAWELITYIGNVFNRLAIFKGGLYHKSVLPGFGHDKYSGRITQTFFFNVTDNVLG